MSTTLNKMGYIESFIKSKYPDIRYNLLTSQVEIGGQPLDDMMFNTIYVDLKMEVDKASKEDLNSFIKSNRTIKYDPIIEWLGSLGCVIGQPRVGQFDPKRTPMTEQLALTLTGDKDYLPYVTKFLLHWGVGLIYQATGMHNSEHMMNSLMPVLVGPQNAGKSSWIRQLFPKHLHKYIKEKMSGDTAKDGNFELANYFLIIDDEFNATKKADITAFKATMTRGGVKQRRVYERFDSNLERRASFFGTSNESEIIFDTTGNRRIIPIKTTQIDWVLFNNLNKDDIVREWVSAYMAGWDFRLTADDIAYLNSFDNEHTAANPDEEALFSVFKHPDDFLPFEPTAVWLTATEILQRVCIRFDKVRLSSYGMGKLLTKHAFEKQANTKRYKMVERPV